MAIKHYQNMGSLSRYPHLKCKTIIIYVVASHVTLASSRRGAVGLACHDGHVIAKVDGLFFLLQCFWCGPGGPFVIVGLFGMLWAGRGTAPAAAALDTALAAGTDAQGANNGIRSLVRPAAVGSATMRMVVALGLFIACAHGSSLGVAFLGVVNLLGSEALVDVAQDGDLHPPLTDEIS